MNQNIYVTSNKKFSLHIFFFYIHFTKYYNAIFNCTFYIFMIIKSRNWLSLKIMDLSLTFCKVFSTPNFSMEINNSNITWIATSTLSSMIMFHKCICAWASSIQFFGFNVFLCNRHSLTMLQLTPFESISKSMDLNNLSCNTHRRKKLPFFFQNRVYTSHTLPNVCAILFFNMICEDYINLQTNMCMFMYLWDCKKNLIQFWKLEKIVNNLFIQTWAHHGFSTQINLLTKVTIWRFDSCN